MEIVSVRESARERERQRGPRILVGPAPAGLFAAAAQFGRSMRAPSRRLSIDPGSITGRKRRKRKRRRRKMSMPQRKLSNE